MVRPGLDPAEALAALGIGGAEEVQHVEMFLTEGQRALGAIDLEVMLHLAAGGDPVALDRRRWRHWQSAEGAADVVDLTARRPPLPSGRSPITVTQSPMTRVIGPHRNSAVASAWTADIGQRAAARRIVAEGVGAGGVGHVILAVDAAIAADLTQLARRDHLAGQNQHRVAQIVEADLGLDALRPRRPGSFPARRQPAGPAAFRNRHACPRRWRPATSPCAGRWAR